MPDRGWPRTLSNVGWEVSVIEPKWNVDVPGQQQPGTILPDLVVAIRRDEHLILFEAKVGTVQTEQLDRYLLLTLEKLMSQSPEQPISDFQIAYAATSEHETSCLQSLSGHPVPLVTFSDDVVKSGNAAFSHQPTQDILAPGIQLNGARVPQHFIPIDTDSSDEEVLQAVGQALILLAVEEQQTFSDDDVLRKVFGDWYRFLSSQYRTELRTTIRSRGLSKLAHANVLGTYLFQSGGDWGIRGLNGGENANGIKAFITAVTREMQRGQFILDV